MNTNFHIYTDGACSGNPGPGGPGFVIIKDDKTIVQSKPEGFRKTTNNRMEIKAVSLALDCLMKKFEDALSERDTDIKVTVFSDSQLVVKTLTEGWAKKTNKDLWDELEETIYDLKRYSSQKLSLEFRWVKGHDKNKWNNLADQIAVEASKNPVNVDGVYENIAPLEKAATIIPVEPVPEPTVREVRLLNYDKPKERKIVVILSNNTPVTILPCHGGFQQCGCTTAESRVTVDIAWEFVNWLNGAN